MLLYLKSEGFLKRFSDIDLEGCCEPKIGSVHEARVSPAIWFKVLVIDSVFIDCDQRMVSWNRDNQEASSFHRTQTDKDDVQTVSQFFRSKERMWKDSAPTDFDMEAHELFDTAKAIVSCLKHETLDETRKFSTQRSVLKLLHRSVLPAIKLYRKDLDNLNVALKFVDDQLRLLENRIQQKYCNKRTSEISLKKQRESIMNSDLLKDTCIAKCDPEFLKCLLQHFEKDEVALRSEMLSLEKEKITLEAQGSDACETKLSDVRQRRLESNTMLKNLLMTREEIKSVVSMPHQKKKSTKPKGKKAKPVQDSYVCLTRELDKLTAEVHNLINTKVKITSVKQAVVLSIREVEQEGESFGCHRKTGTWEMETDVLDPDEIPQDWHTLPEQVSHTVNSPGYIKDRFVNFCDMIRSKCKIIQSEAAMFSIETVSLPTCSVVEADLKKLTSDIVNHIWEVAGLLEQHFEKRGQSFDMKKLYICYEAHVSADLLPVVSEIYELYFRNVCDPLSSWLKTTTPEVIGFNDSCITSLLEPDDTKSASEEHYPDTITVCDVLDIAEEQHPLPPKKVLALKSPKKMGILRMYDDRECTVTPNDFPEALSANSEEEKEDLYVDMSGGATCGCVKLEAAPINDSHTDDRKIENDVRGRSKSDNIKDKVEKSNSGSVKMEKRSGNGNKQETVFADFSHMSPTLQGVFTTFERFYEFLVSVTNACTLFKKVKEIHQALHYISTQLGTIRYQSEVLLVANSDELVSVCVLLLSKLDSRTFLKIYSHIHLLRDLCPNFMQGSSSDYALTTFAVAFLHLQGLTN